MWWSRWSAGLALALAVSLVASASAGEPRVTARAAIVIDAASGQTLWEDNGDVELPPASTTKVLTAILALESGRLDDWFEVSEYAASTAPSKLGLRPGQQMQLRDLLYAVLLKSANDASTVVAEGLAGSESRFAARMTARAHALGATSSHFENAHGLSAPGHLSTVRDLARVFRHGLRLPGFRDMLETPSVAVPVQGRTMQTVSVRSHNRLLTGWTHQVIGKTGYTRPAKRCFVGAASNGEREVVIAILGSSDLWGDARRLVAFGFGEEADEPAPPVVVAEPERPEPRVPTWTAFRAARSVPTRVAAKSVPTRVAAKGGPPRATVKSTPARGAAKTVPTRLAATTRRAERRVVVEGDRDDEAAVPRRYAVQLGPYGSRNALKTTRIALARRGFQSVAVGSSIRLGSFPTKQSANTLAGRVRGSGYRPSVVALR